MSFTQSQLAEAIYDWTTEDATTEVGENIDTIVALAYRRLQRDLDLDIFIATDAGTLAASNNTLSRPTDMIEISEIYYLSGNDRVPLEKRSFAYVQDYWPNAATTGDPKYWAENSLSDIIIAPTPASMISYFIRYLSRVTPLTTTMPDGTDWISRNMSDLLLFACLEEAEAFLHEEARGRVGLWRGKYAEQLPKAQAEVAGMTRVTGDRKRMEGSVKPPVENRDE